MLKISIITAAYNSGKTLGDTIESVLRQTYGDYEHLIIDGGSKDNTLEVIKEYEPRYNGKLRWISEPDHGIYDAMNKGIAMATGDIVGILNSDDFYTSDGVLEKLVAAFEETGSDAVYGDVHFVDSEDLTKVVRYYSSKSFKRWKMRLGWMPAHPSFYCRRSVYEKYGTFDTSFKIGADFENLLRLVFIGRINMKYIPLDCVTMRIGGVSTQGLDSHRQILADHMKAYKKNGIYSNVLFEGLRYMEKIFEIVRFKISTIVMGNYFIPKS